jgi:hypothetical protein
MSSLACSVAPYLCDRAGRGSHVDSGSARTLQECADSWIAVLVCDEYAGVQNQGHAAPSAPMIIREAPRALAINLSISAGSSSPSSDVRTSSASRSLRWRTRACAASASHVETLTPCSLAAAHTAAARSESREMDNFSAPTRRILPPYYRAPTIPGTMAGAKSGSAIGDLALPQHTRRMNLGRVQDPDSAIPLDRIRLTGTSLWLLCRRWDSNPHWRVPRTRASAVGLRRLAVTGAPGIGERMAVGTEDTEVRQPVVSVVTVDRVEREREVLAAARSCSSVQLRWRGILNCIEHAFDTQR